MKTPIAIICTTIAALCHGPAAGRNFQPSVGRYMQTDPKGLSAGPNQYRHVNANPLTATDPTGLDTAMIIGGPTSGNPFGHVYHPTCSHSTQDNDVQIVGYCHRDRADVRLQSDLWQAPKLLRRRSEFKTQWRALINASAVLNAAR